MQSCAEDAVFFSDDQESSVAEQAELNNLLLQKRNEIDNAIGILNNGDWFINIYGPTTVCENIEKEYEALWSPNVTPLIFNWYISDSWPPDFSSTPYGIGAGLNLTVPQEYVGEDYLILTLEAHLSYTDFSDPRYFAEVIEIITDPSGEQCNIVVYPCPGVGWVGADDECWDDDDWPGTLN